MIQIDNDITMNHSSIRIECQGLNNVKESAILMSNSSYSDTFLSYE